MSRESLELELVSFAPQLSDDELRVLLVQARRMIRIGRGKYGPLDLSREQRDWGAERAAEQSDRLFYDSCEEVARAERRRELDFSDEEITNARGTAPPQPAEQPAPPVAASPGTGSSFDTDPWVHGAKSAYAITPEMISAECERIKASQPNPSSPEYRGTKPAGGLQHCADCNVFDGHREDCPYVVVVPGRAP